MLATVLEIIFAALLLYGVWHREKLIEFEDRVLTCVKEMVRR